MARAAGSPMLQTGDPCGILLAFEGEAAHLPAVGGAVGVPLDRQAAAPEVLDLAVSGAGEEGKNEIAGILEQPGQVRETVTFGVVSQDRLDPGLAVGPAEDRLIADLLRSGPHDGGGLVDQVPVAGQGDPVAAERVRDRVRAGLTAPGGQRPACGDVLVQPGSQQNGQLAVGVGSGLRWRRGPPLAVRGEDIG